MSKPCSKLNEYKEAKTRAELADLLQIKHKVLTYLLYVKKDEEKYFSFNIPKKNGGVREIFAPITELKSLQRRLANDLQVCLQELEGVSRYHNNASHGFVRNKSILTNAKAHKNKRFVFNIDLRDFFPAISGQRIRGFLINDERFKFSEQVATTIAHIACREGVLPQGSPCSPVISNLIAGILDVHLARLAKKYGCRYTRYADDITFSTNKKEFPTAIAYKCSSDSHKWLIGVQLEKLISKSGFIINETKTRMQYKDSRQEVTGLVVNKRINVTAEYRHLVRAYVFSLINKGFYEIRSTAKDESGNMTDTVSHGSIAKLHGMLGYIHSVDNVLVADLKKNPNNYSNVLGSTSTGTDTKISSMLAMYRRFLFFTRFYNNNHPMVVCEGKTDNVYISSAVPVFVKVVGT